MPEKKLTREEALAGQEFLERLERVFSTPEGMVVANRIMSECQIMVDVFQTSSMNAYDQGRQAIGQWLFACLVEANPRLTSDIMMLGLDEMSAERRELRMAAIDQDE
jgi:hypothetical protein